MPIPKEMVNRRKSGSIPITNLDMATSTAIRVLSRTIKPETTESIPGAKLPTKRRREKFQMPPHGKGTIYLPEGVKLSEDPAVPGTTIKKKRGGKSENLPDYVKAMEKLLKEVAREHKRKTGKDFIN